MPSDKAGLGIEWDWEAIRKMAGAPAVIGKS
jgi:hypothetical protein